MYHRVTGYTSATLVITWLTLGPAPVAAQDRGLLVIGGMDVRRPGSR